MCFLKLPISWYFTDSCPGYYFPGTDPLHSFCPRGREEKSWYPGQKCRASVIALLFSHSRVPTLCDPMDCIMPGFSVLHYLLEFSQIQVNELVILSNLCCPVLLSSSIFSSIRVFSSEPALTIMWHESVKYQLQSFQLIFRVISFKIDWFDLLTVP